VAKKCPVLHPGWIMVNVNELAGEARSLILLENPFDRIIG
jgi:hypothetical protein